VPSCGRGENPAARGKKGTVPEGPEMRSGGSWHFLTETVEPHHAAQINKPQTRHKNLFLINNDFKMTVF
jgi:hypothetical protein